MLSYEFLTRQPDNFYKLMVNHQDLKYSPQFSVIMSQIIDYHRHIITFIYSYLTFLLLNLASLYLACFLS